MAKKPVVMDVDEALDEGTRGDGDEQPGRNNPERPSTGNPGSRENRPEPHPHSENSPGDEPDDDGESADSVKRRRQPEEKRGRQGMQSRPHCPVCSKGKDKPVFCLAGSSQSLVTYYYCPNRCGFSVSLPRPDIAQQMRRHEPQTGFSARP